VTDDPNHRRDCGALNARIVALGKMLDEREMRSVERFDAIKESVAFALAAADKALTKAEAANEKRFDSVNEFRETLADQAAKFMLTNVYDVERRAIADKLDSLTARIGNVEAHKEGKTSGIAMIGAIFYGTIIGCASIGALILNFLRH
jgi:hypothetical protein